MSGGFPHSEIHGSKPIPGSPWLNAGYHVLHRLLLPRHPPNALFALDLIQKETDSFRLVTLGGHRIKSMYFPTEQFLRTAPVSVLDLEQYRPTQRRQGMRPRKRSVHPLLGRTRRY